MRRIRILPLALPWLLALGLGWCLAAGLPPAVRPVQAISAAEEEDHARYILYLTPHAAPDPDTLPIDPLARRRQLVTSLQEQAAAAQAPLLDRLERLENEGGVSSYRPLWIVNGVAVHGEPAAVAALAADPAVAAVRADRSRVVLHQTHETPDPTQLLQPRAVGSAADGPPERPYGILQIRAPHAWHGLGISGTGATVAIVDTGVDWLHPDLLPAYRGLRPDGTAVHEGNWYHAAYPTRTVPSDRFWHGTHVAGTAVGQREIGVAPGARWIGVSIADDFGFIYDSYILAAFEWLLAPGGDPALAPDIVNGSWGGAGVVDIFEPAVKQLLAAGIIPVFSAGNNGPLPATINAPASYGTTLAVGATDFDGRLAWFSSRGPSPLTPGVKPEVAAPGAVVLSAFPDSGYAYASGTSMAAPHVAGAAALLRAADPSLDLAGVTAILTKTARPLGAAPPDFESGWGEIDLYAAAAEIVPHGVLRGRLTEQGRSAPLAGLSLTITTPAGAALGFTTDAQGEFRAPLRPGSYRLQVAPFGFESEDLPGLRVDLGRETVVDVNLARLPGGIVRGEVRIGGEPAAGGIVALQGTPLAAAVGANGGYELQAPTGVYTLAVTALGGRSRLETIAVTNGGTAVRSYHLAPAPRILLVDGGRWYYDSQLSYYRASLAEAGYAAEVWEVADPLADSPPLAELLPYEVLIWSDPEYSPGVIGANRTISDYLGTGGSLLISGQNVGLIESLEFFPIWWSRLLQGRWLEKGGVTQTLRGAPESGLAGLTFTLNDPAGATNQTGIDVVEPQDRSMTRPVVVGADGRAVALAAGRCQPHQMLYFGFGLEAISPPAARTALLAASLDYFQAPPPAREIRWLNEPIDDFAVRGERITYTLEIQNLSESLTETLAIDAVGGSWTRTVVTPTLVVGPCEIGRVDLVVETAEGLPRGSTHAMRIEARRDQQNTPVISLDIRHRTAGRLLLVDDHRFYDELPRYQQALEEIGVAYDLWLVDGENGRGSPPAALLQEFETVIWFTGYDWFAPIRPAERAALEAYLAQGGRLFLTSQDFLYYNLESTLTGRYFGIDRYVESVTPTVLFAGGGPLATGSWTEREPLVYERYLNNGDALLPENPAEALLWHEAGVAAVGRSGPAAGGRSWRGMFWGIPFEMLPAEERPAVMANVLGWLGVLGESSLVLSRTAVTGGDTFPLAIRLAHGPGDQAEGVTVTLMLAGGLELVGAPRAELDARSVATWSGIVPAGELLELPYQIAVAESAPTGRPLTITALIDDGFVRFSRQAVVWVDAPDLSRSSVSVVHDAPRPVSHTITVTIHLVNGGLAAAEGISATWPIPRELSPLTPTLQTTGGQSSLVDRRLQWEGDLDQGETAAVSLVLTRTQSSRPTWLPAAVTVYEPQTGYRIVYVQERLPSFRSIFPVFVMP